MTIFICTTGTSIAGGAPFGASSDEYRKNIRARLEKLRAEYAALPDFLKFASAETNSLSSLGVGLADEAVFLTTETPDGVICAEEASRILQVAQVVSTRSIKIDGLQVTDTTRFRRVGVQKLFEVLDQLCGRESGSDNQVVLNVTGGFKSVVPYVTLYGQLRRISVAYLFERSEQHLLLPPMPIGFDFERLSQAKDALELLKREGAVSVSAFFEAIPGIAHHEREWYESLVEEENGSVTLSAFGGLLVSDSELSRPKIFISPNAQQQFDSSRGATQEQFAFMLERVGDPLWRGGKIHTFKGTDLTIIKPGNTGERMACIVRGQRIYVCELMKHDEYERILPGRKAAQYDLRGFTQWLRPEHVPEPPKTEAEAFRRAIQQLEISRKESEVAFAEAQKAEEAMHAAVLECASQSDARAAVESQLADANKELRSLRAETAAMTGQLEQLRRPWWRRLFVPSRCPS